MHQRQRDNTELLTHAKHRSSFFISIVHSNPLMALNIYAPVLISKMSILKLRQYKYINVCDWPPGL